MTRCAQIRVEIAVDGNNAQLVLPPLLDGSLVTPEALTLILKAAGVAINQDVVRNIAALAANYGSGDAERTGLIARAVPAVQGEDGQMEWSEGFDPHSKPEHARSEARSDHYAGHPYVRVKTGDIIGTARQPTDGVDGRDVRGGVIKAVRGKPIPIKFCHALTADSAGRIVAQVNGVLTLGKGEVKISAALEVPRGVNFSTGHIEFAGSVNIAGGVSSGFKVTAGGDIHVGMLIEDADIRCTGDLVSRGGMAGHGRGTINVGHNAHVVYLENVTGEIKGDLVVDREIADCHLVVGKDVLCPSATVLGGHLAVAGSLVVKTIGSEAYTPTTVQLGHVPLLLAGRVSLLKEVSHIKAKLTQLVEQERLLKLNPRPSPAERERLTESSYEISEQNQELTARTVKLHKIDAAVRRQRTFDVRITLAIHPGVRLHIGEFVAVFKDVAKGPLWIGWDEQGLLVWKAGSGAPRPLSELAQVMQGHVGSADVPMKRAAAA